MTTLGAAALASLAIASPSAAGFPRVERVTFQSAGETLVGHLYLPAESRPGQRVPGAVVTGAWMTVKEQMPGRYARELAQRGYAALAFDFRGWGESGGAERQKEDPTSKIEDVQAAVAFLATRPDVDPRQIVGLGICASAGYMAHAAARTPALRAVALVAPWLHDHAIVEEVYGGRQGVEGLVATGRKAEQHYRLSGEMTLVPAASTTDRSALMFGVPYYTESDRGMIPEWRNETNVAFWEGWLTFDGIAAAPSIRQPTLIVHSEAAAIPQGARRFLAGVTAPKSELWLENVSQFDFYDRAEPVRRASDAVATHFRSVLGTQPAEAAGAGEAVVESFFRSLETRDLEGFLALWAEDGAQVMPFAPAGFPERLQGKAAIRNQYGSLPENFRSMRFPREILPLAERGRFVVRYTGEIELMGGGRYDNTYVGLFTIRGGQVTEFVEYFDPIVLQTAFGTQLQENFNVRP